MILDLLIPTDHAEPYLWAVVYLAHFAVGLFLTALVAALLDALDDLRLNVGDTAPALVTVGYLVIWEMGVQRLGAGLPDALLDTLAIGLGAASGLYLWRRDGKRLAVALSFAAAVLWRGVRTRR